MDTYLMHHGIKGMKWGIRRYQNPDGSLTAAGQKRYNKEFAKEAKKTYKKESSNPYDRYDRISALAANSLSDEQKKILIKKYQKFYDEYTKNEKVEQDFDSSDEKWEAQRKAYNDTVKWYEKNDPEKLKEWSKQVDTSDDWALNDIRDFYKDYGYAEDDYVDKARNKYMKEHGASESKEDRAFTNYVNQVNETTNSLIGKYGQTKLRDLSRPNIDLSSYVHSGVSQIAREAVSTQNALKFTKEKSNLDPQKYWSDDSHTNEYASLQNLIEKKSGDTYFGKAKTKNFETAYSNYKTVMKNVDRRNVKEYSKKKEEAEDQVLNAVIKDLNLENTKKNRDMLRPVVFYD